MQGMDDPKTEHPELILESLEGLSRIMKLVDGKNVVSILVTICVKLRPYFETVGSWKHSILFFGLVSN